MDPPIGIGNGAHPPQNHETAFLLLSAMRTVAHFPS